MSTGPNLSDVRLRDIGQNRYGLKKLFKTLVQWLDFQNAQI